MDKRTAALYSALAAFTVTGPSAPSVHAQSREKTDATDQRAADRARRKVEVVRTPASGGISSGLVVVYGHPLPQPYHFEYWDHLLFVNGVQVEPTIVMQRDHDKNPKEELTPEKADKFNQLNALANEVRKHYFDEAGKVPEDKLHEEILSRVRSHPLIKEAHWMNEKILVYTRTDDKYPSGNGISFSSPSPRASVKPPPQDKIKADHIAELEAHLKTGHCLFFGAIGAWRGYGRQCGDIKKRVIEVMKDSSIPEVEKEKKLKDAFGGSSENAKDIMSNYNESEWK